MPVLNFVLNFVSLISLVLLGVRGGFFKKVFVHGFFGDRFNYR